MHGVTAENGSPRVAIACAFPGELEPALARLSGLCPLALPGVDAFGTLRFDRLEVDFVALGTGESIARSAAEALLGARSPCSVLLVGIAGALAPELRIGDAVVASWLGRRSAVDERQRVYPHPSLTDTLRAQLCGAGVSVHLGGLLTSGNAVVCSRADKLAARTSSSALAVDMESCAVAQACADRGIRFAAVRFVSDGVDDELPPWLNTCFDPATGFDQTRIAAEVSANPALASALLNGSARAIARIRASLPALILAIASVK